MKKKEAFLRAIQRVKPADGQDAPMIFRWALNLKESAIPPNIEKAARKFVRRLSA